MVVKVKPMQAQFREAGTTEWLPAQIPGGVHTDLMALGRIPDPFVADNELQVQWVAERDWEYQVTFQASADLLAQERVELVCDGLDTLAQVSFNGQPLGETDNMFRQYRWDVTGLVHAGENVLSVRFNSTVAYISAKQMELPLRDVVQAIPGGPYVRKAPCQFGWDWGPQLPPIGFWKEVRLEGYTTARLVDVHVRQQHADGVMVGARVVLDRWQPVEIRAVLTLIAPDGDVQQAQATLSGEGNEALLTVTVANPQLWWPNGYGAQPLYAVQVTLYQGETLLDAWAYKVGLRTIELRQERDEFGKSFVFVVNGVPVFAKGADWIPTDSFPTRITDDLLHHLIHSTAAAHMNMLRVWGGGFYEEERFYDLCDRYGILVWQDFVFSCSIYPDDEAFFANVYEEAVQNVRRLRHRASLALWCGNNEMEAGWVHWGWRERQPEALRFKAAYDRMFHHLLPEVCAAEDPDHAYWPSSPSSGVAFDEPGGVNAGDTHNWEVWHGGRPFSFYRTIPSRFVSEFGFQSLPDLATVRTYAGEADWNMTSYIMEHHQRNASGNGKIINYMTDHFRMPKDFPSLVYLTQLLQAEAVRTGVEFWRRNRACTGGTLYWQLNDCWPVASWASLDYYGRWKALHYIARRFYAPVLLSAEEEGAVVTLYVTSDLLDTWVGTVRWSLETLDGDVLTAGQEPVTVSALGVIKVITLDLTAYITPATRRRVVLVYELWHEDARMTLGVTPFIPTKHLALETPGLTAAVVETADGFMITVATENLARFVCLTLESADPALNTDVVFSDNYFDLAADRFVMVQMPAGEGWTVEKVQAALRVRSLVDSY